MTAEAPRRPLVRWALLVGLGAAVVPVLLTAGPVFLANPGAWTVSLLVVLQAAAIVAIGATTLAVGEQLAAERLRAGRTAAGLLAFAVASLLAAASVAANTAWALALWAGGGPEEAAQGALRRLLQLDGHGAQLLLVALLPVGFAATRAARSQPLAVRLGLLVLTLGGLVAGLLLVDLTGVDGLYATLSAVAGGMSYILGTILADRLVPAPAEPEPPPLARLVALPLLLVGAVAFARQLGVPPTGLAALGVGGCAGTLLWAWRVKRRVVAAFEAWSLVPLPPPPDFERALLEPLEGPLAAQGLRVTLLRQPSKDPTVVQALAEGAGPRVAHVLFVRRAGGWALHGTTLLTDHAADHSVLTSSCPTNGAVWLLARPTAVVDHRPGATLDELAVRHAADVAALATIAGPPTGPGTGARLVELEAARWPELIARVRALPALRLLACLLWFNAPRPVRLRGPLPV